MRIAVIASIAHRVPPRGYGPWEQVAATLTEGLVARGHEVTLFATADSLTTARLHATAAAGYEEDPSRDAKVDEALHLASVFERADRFDVISNQFDFLPLAFSRLVATPVVTTVHGFSSEKILPVYRAYDDVTHYVSISDASRHPDLTYAATIHHGIDPGTISLGGGDGGHLLFLGRIHPDKGTALAVEVARRAGRPLVIAGVIHDRDYFRSSVEPHLDGEHVTYVGPVGPAERDHLLGGAVAMLHLIDFEEPFGLSVAESMMAGTPVVAHPRGSMPELVRPGVNGFLVDDVDQAVAAVEQAALLDRARCRADAVDRFSHDRMVEAYEALFERVVGSADAGPGRAR
ncbi:glycosyltransferase family 4 protein [Serinibacter arcticus]|uniref:Mannose-6-phosphate isomerase, bifunctional enzyme n=1 Tax=Serinibacter arcticus TaxID=1655435 RepID=A0A4Z1E4N0_9MICO|nr:glycosyltransferase family 4 protein [Serinibacter arcticus]TGO05433.1 Mannose-6-phosphate isomerase, bifunctional enzyme [Serinibacter arcticus]